MSLIDKSYFVLDLDIPNTSNTNVETKLNRFIADQEPLFLKLLFGPSLYASFSAGLLVDPIAAEWIALRDFDGLKKALAAYVYCEWMENENTKSTASGESKPEVENATAVSVGRKVCKAWNKYIHDWICSFTTYMNTNAVLYPDWTPQRGYFFKYQVSNAFGFRNPIF